MVKVLGRLKKCKKRTLFYSLKKKMRALGVKQKGEGRGEGKNLPPQNFWGKHNKKGVKIVEYKMYLCIPIPPTTSPPFLTLVKPWNQIIINLKKTVKKDKNIVKIDFKHLSDVFDGLLRRPVLSNNDGHFLCYSKLR